MSHLTYIFADQTPQYPAVLIASRLKRDLRLEFGENVKVDLVACSGRRQLLAKETVNPRGLKLEQNHWRRIKVLLRDTA